MATDHQRPGFWGTFRSYLVAGAVLCVLAGVVGIMPALTAPMLFDVPGADSSVLIWIFVVLVIAFPLASFAAPVVAYVAYRRGGRVVAALILGTPAYVALCAWLVWLLSAALCGAKAGCVVPSFVQ